MRDDPDWAGKCTCSHTLGHSAIAATTGVRKSFGCGLVNRMRSMPETASHARRSAPNSISTLGTEIAAPRVDVLPEEGYLADARLGETRDLREDLPRPPALLTTPHGRDDAVRAGRVASHRDLHPGLKATLAAGREVGGKVLVRTEATAFDREAAGGDPVAEVRYRAGAEGDVDEWIELEDPLSLRLGVAATDGDDHVGTLALHGAGVPEVRREPCVGLLADGARVEDDDVGLVRGSCFAQPERLEHALDPLRVVRVHLAAERRDVIPPHRPRSVARSATAPSP